MITSHENQKLRKHISVTRGEKNQPDELKCIWQILFLFARLNLPNVVISIAKKIFDSGFPSPCFDVPAFSYFLINNALLYHFLASWLAHNKEMTEKSVFREGWSPEMTSQSFPVSCLWSRVFLPHRKWNLTHLVYQNMGKENRYRKCFFAIHISTLRRFHRANEKNLSAYTL